ncbi:hypothetical protein [Azospirillum sp. TSH58]|uniref:hypothetical protein n=1 Tax=Azospirillum sp. TSH58 TaxID=664962 RepID=UPI0011B204C8|nr:hypothetical protein [Azospirillum sp. TSH58]
MSSFLDLQNGFYNGLCQGLGLSQNTFQILQPSPPLVANNNTLLWDYFNNIPPLSLTQNYIASGGNQFFSNYKGIISSLVAPPNTFEADIGPDNFRAWKSYIAGIVPPPAANQLPSTFFQWAMINAPTVANVGAQDLSAMLLETVSAASLALMPYTSVPFQTPPAPPPDWNAGYSVLVQQLSQAPSRSFTFSSSTMNSNVSSSWSKGGNSGFFGLWGGSSSSSSQSTKFAASNVQITKASFRHVLTFAASPGNWYSSSAMGLAYSSSASPPWKQGGLPSWKTVFDPATGTTTRFMVNLIVADTMYIEVTSDARFDANDQSVINNNKSSGLWPFYTSGSGSGSSTSVSFNQNGNMTVTITSDPGVPIVLGGNVLPVQTYLGHSTAALKAVSDKALALA